MLRAVLLSSALTIVLFGGLGASEVAAQENLSYDGGDPGMFHCDLMVECGGGVAVCSEEQLCGGVGALGGESTVPQFCHYAEESFVCCDSSGSGAAEDDCLLYHTPDESEPDLVARGDCLSAATDRGVCNYPIASEADGTPETFTFCAEAPEDAAIWVRPCMTGVDGVPVEHWGHGDCDGDGVTNADEFFEVGCDPCDYDDLPTPERDGCMKQPVLDAGTDGGADSGPGSDAAADSGSASDAARDATPGVDSSDGTGSFRGTGGCTCRAAGSAPMRGGALPVGLSFAALIGLAFRSGLRRRR